MYFRHNMTVTCCITQKKNAFKHQQHFKPGIKKDYIYILKLPLMKKISITLLLAVIFIQNLLSQDIKSPSDFLGYELGTQFTYHHRAIEYFKYVADASPLVEFRSYGSTYEGRELGVCIISSE